MCNGSVVRPAEVGDSWTSGCDDANRHCNMAQPREGSLVSSRARGAYARLLSTRLGAHERALLSRHLAAIEAVHRSDLAAARSVSAESVSALESCRSEMRAVVATAAAAAAKHRQEVEELQTRLAAAERKAEAETANALLTSQALADALGGGDVVTTVLSGDLRIAEHLAAETRRTLAQAATTDFPLYTVVGP